MDDYWIKEFRRRIQDFDAECPVGEGVSSVSIKIRPVSGCCCSSHSPEVCDLVRRHRFPTTKDDRFMVIEHESGPEILTLVQFTTAGLSLTAGVIALTTAILNARAKDRHKGDRSGGPVKVIVRTIRRDGEYREEDAIEVDCVDPVTEVEIEEILTSATCKVLDGQEQPMANPKAVRKSLPRRRSPAATKPSKGK